MGVPNEVYQMEMAVRRHLPMLRRAPQSGLVWWVYGTILAHSACQTAVIMALRWYGGVETIRQRLREWLYDGPDKASPCHSQVEVSRCFGGLLSWLPTGWQGQELALVLDVTLPGEPAGGVGGECAVLRLCDSGGVTPVSGESKRGLDAGDTQVIGPVAGGGAGDHDGAGVSGPGAVESDPVAGITAVRGHPLVRIQNHMTFAASGRDRCPVAALVRPGQAWVGRGRLGSPKRARLSVTLVVVWTVDQKAP